MTTEQVVLGFPVRAELTWLDDGVHILLTGGQQSHIGGISTAEPDGSVQTLSFPCHKDHLISEQWAVDFARLFRCRTAVVCGIHYDNLSPDGLQTVLQELENLEDFLKVYEQRKQEKTDTLPEEKPQELKHKRKINNKH